MAAVYKNQQYKIIFETGVDLTGVTTPELEILDPAGNLSQDTMTVDDTTSGTISYEWSQGSLSTAGAWRVAPRNVDTGGVLAQPRVFHVIELFERSTVPTAQELYEFLEGYNIDSTDLSEAWVARQRDGFVIPWIQRKTGLSITGEVTEDEYYSGNGGDVLVLNRKPIKSLNDISILGVSGEYQVSVSQVEVLKELGALRTVNNWAQDPALVSFWPRGTWNIKLNLTYGYAEDAIPQDIRSAVLYLMVDTALAQLSARTGGGSLTVENYSRDYGELGRWHDIRRDVTRWAISILSGYWTGVTM